MSLSLMDIQRFALHDGPGIRTTVFLQGCPLRCPWCANPESQRVGSHLMYIRKRCIGCGRCAAVCPSGCAAMPGDMPAFDRALCTGCGRCVQACPAQALRLSGETMEAKEIVSILLRDQSYYARTGGGVTLSGGEPFMQAEGLGELLALCKASGLATAVETTGNAPSKHITALEPLIDLFLYDLKHVDAATFGEVTHGDLALVLANLAQLPPAKVTLRIPVIPGFNFEEKTIRAMFDLALAHGVRRVDLLPYHTLGKSKYEQLGLAYPWNNEKALTKKDLAGFQSLGESLGLEMG